MASDDGLAYEPGIDGLRAIAVIVVLLFHGGFGWAGGGFLGVSVFFTLSGFLITRLLLAEHARSGRISLPAFWGRRLRRLAPASLACLFGIVLTAAWWGAASARSALRVDVWSALTYWPNWRFAAAHRSYAELFASPSPVLHFWSLAIEEQFYLVFPIVVAATLTLGRRFGRTLLTVVLGLLLAGSLVATSLTHDRTLIYYGTHTRAGEMLVGALVAIGVARVKLSVRRAAVAAWLGVIAFVAIVVCCWRTTIDSGWLYDGRLVDFAVLSAVAVVGATQPGPLRRALSTGPLVAVGRVSYGVYLFHWPLFLLINERRTGWTPAALFPVRIAATAAISLLSYRLLEQPIRARRALTMPRPAVVAFAGAVVLVAAVAPLTGSTATGAPSAAAVPSGVVTFDPTSGRPESGVSSIETGAAASAATTPAPVATLPPPAGPVTAAAGTGPSASGPPATGPPAPEFVASESAAPVGDPPATGFAGDSSGTKSGVASTSTSTSVPGRRAVIAFAGADLSVRGRLAALDNVEVRDLLPPGCPLASNETEAGCPAAAAAIARALPLIEPDLVVVVVSTQDRAAIAASDGQARLAMVQQLARDLRAGADAAFASDVPGLIIDTSSLADALSVVDNEIDLAHPEAWLVDSKHLRAEAERLVGRGPSESPSSSSTSVAATVAPPAASRLRLMVIGDSTSYDVAASLARTASGFEVTWAGGANCPVVDVTGLRWWDAAQWPMDECPNVATVWPRIIAATRPDVILLVSGLAEQAEQRYQGSDAWRVAGDAEFTEAHDMMMNALVGLAAPSGAVVLVADAPAFAKSSFSDSQMGRPERIAAWNAQIARWDATWQPVARLDYASALAQVESDGPRRSDGVHLDAASSDRLARLLTPEIIDSLGALRHRVDASGCRSERDGSLALGHCREPA